MKKWHFFGTILATWWHFRGTLMAQNLNIRDILIQSKFLPSSGGKFFYGGMAMLKVKNIPIEAVKAYDNTPR